MPFPYKKILCPVDFEENSGEALKEAASLASIGGATLLVLHVVKIETFDDPGATGGVAVESMYDSRIELARKQVEQMLDAIAAGVKREVLVEVGEPAVMIQDVQARVGADLVVMATHGRRGFKHFILGSVTERVVRESRVPVLTVRPLPSGQAE